MKKQILILFTLVISLNSFAQQTEQLTQYMFNQFGLNPAFAGLKECVDVRLGFRAQWIGFEGAPRTGFANANGRILKRKTNHRYKHGLGGSAIADATGPTSRTFFDVAYAFHMPLSHKLTASFGISAGFLQYRFDRSKVTLANVNDNAISGSQSKFILPDINAGLLVYNENFYAGLTMKQVWRNKVKEIFPDTRLTHHYYFNLGKKFGKGKDVVFVPSIMLKFTRLSIPSLDINCMFDFDNVLAVGLSYRNTDAIAAMFKVNFLKRFSFGYSFDLTTSKIRYGSSNTHEFILGIYSCPLSDNHNYECPVF